MMPLDLLPLGFVWASYGILALVVGSFISLLTWRVPDWFAEDTPALWRSIAQGRSRCCHCQTPLRVHQLIPVISWLWQKGRAPCCAQTIPARYPLIELSSLLLTGLLLAFTPLNTAQPLLSIHLNLLSQLLLLWALLAIAVIDLEHQRIPDRLSLSLLWLGLLVNSTNVALIPLSEAVWGAMFGYVSLWLLFQLHRAITGKIGMGYGDFKLTAAIGAWLGWQALLPVFILAGGGAVLTMGLALLWGKHQLNQHFAFGPWLSMAGVVMLLWQI